MNIPTHVRNRVYMDGRMHERLVWVRGVRDYIEANPGSAIALANFLCRMQIDFSERTRVPSAEAEP